MIPEEKNAAVARALLETLDVSDFEDIRRLNTTKLSGEVTLATDEAKVEYGTIHMNQLLQNVAEARFQDALRIVADRHAGSSFPAPGHNE